LLWATNLQHLLPGQVLKMSSKGHAQSQLENNA